MTNFVKVNYSRTKHQVYYSTKKAQRTETQVVGGLLCNYYYLLKQLCINTNLNFNLLTWKKN